MNNNDTDAITEFTGKYRFLSNYWKISVNYDGINYPSTEHAYQGAKTSDQKEVQQILACKTCEEARILGQKVTLRPYWVILRWGIMRYLTFQKFNKSKSLQEKLLATGDRPLLAGNDHGDVYWGVCNGEGRNCLGKFLMEIRDNLRTGN